MSTAFPFRPSQKGPMPEPDADPVVQRIISAADAPRPQTTGASSVFAMSAAPTAQARPAPAPGKNALGLRGNTARCVMALDTYGPLRADQLAEVTGLTKRQTADICSTTTTRGYVDKTRVDGRMVYRARPGAVDRIRPDAREQVDAMLGKGAWKRLEREGALR